MLRIFGRSALLRGGTAFALLLVLLALLPAQPRALAADPQPPTPTTETTTSAAGTVIPDRSSALPYTLNNAFPAAPSRETIAATAADLDTLPQPLTPPAGALDAAALLGGVPAPQPALHLASSHRIFLPALTKSSTPAPPPPPPPPSPADVSVTLWATPSIRVARGGMLTYELRLVNYGAGPSSGGQITLPYNRRQVTLFDARFVTGSGDWVSAIGDQAITVTFGPIAAGGRRTAYLYQRVAADLPNDAVISVRAAHTWRDGRTGGSGASNWTPVLVGGGNDTSAYLWLAVSPASGKAGTRHQFYTDRFIPGEGIVTWLNTPGGVRSLDLRTTADGAGRIWLDWSSAGLAPGSYSLVAYGSRSGLTGVAGFTVLP